MNSKNGRLQIGKVNFNLATRNGVNSLLTKKSSAIKKNSEDSTANDELTSWKRIQQKDVTQKEAEIRKLQEKNKDLLSQLKKMSEKIDIKILKKPIRLVREADPEEKLENMINEQECINKMKKMYEKELDTLNAKLKVKTGYERIKELESRLQKLNNEYLENLLRKKAIENEIAQTEKALLKYSEMKQEHPPQLEESILIKFLQKETEKEIRLNNSKMQEAESQIAKQKLISEFTEKISSLSIQIEEIKKEVIKVVEYSSQLNIEKCKEENLEEKFKQLKQEFSTCTKQGEQEIEDFKQQLQTLSLRHRELCFINRINTHKIQEQQRLRRSSRSPTEPSRHKKNKSEMEIKKECVIFRLNKTRKYRKMRLHNRTSLICNPHLIDRSTTTQIEYTNFSCKAALSSDKEVSNS